MGIRLNDSHLRICTMVICKTKYYLIKRLSFWRGRYMLWCTVSWNAWPGTKLLVLHTNLFMFTFQEGKIIIITENTAKCNQMNSHVNHFSTIRLPLPCPFHILVAFINQVYEQYSLLLAKYMNNMHYFFSPTLETFYARSFHTFV